jgi:hypothetical protein
MIQFLPSDECKEMSDWVSSRMEVKGLTLADREFARLVAITVIVMEAWQVNTLGGNPIKWKRLPMTVTVRPEWNVLLDRYGYNELGMKPLHDSCIIEARKIMQIQYGK